MPWIRAAGIGLIATIGASVTHAQPYLLASDVTADQLIAVDPTTGAPTVVGPLSDPTVASLEFDFNHGILYGSSTTTNRLLRINPANGEVTAVGPLGVTQMHGLAYDPNRDVLYGCSTASEYLYTIDVETGAATEFLRLGVQILGMAIDAENDVLYMCSSAFDGEPELITFNLATWEGVRVGGFGNPNANNMTGLAFDPALGLFGVDNGFFAGAVSQLFSINPETAHATLIGDVRPGNILGLTFIPCPGAATVLAASAALACRRRRVHRQRVLGGGPPRAVAPDIALPRSGPGGPERMRRLSRA